MSYTPPIKIDSATGLLQQFPTSESPVRRVVVEVDFGWVPNTEDDDRTVTVTGETWVTADSPLSAILFGSTADHDAEDAMAEGMVVSIGNVVPGVGFDVSVHAPGGTWGRYNVLVTG